MQYLTMEVADWEGPIVEIWFTREIKTVEDTERVLQEATLFMRRFVTPNAPKAYFLTCYDGLSSVPNDLIAELQDKFVSFNERFSLGDVRYGGAVFAKTLVIATAIRSGAPSALHDSREQALTKLRSMMNT